MAQGTLIKQTDIPAQVGQQKPADARRFLSQQVVYQNYAGRDERLDTAVAAFVLNHREQFRSRMGSAMDRWATIWEAVNGDVKWLEHDDDVHIPETKKAMDSKVSRVEEALFEFDPIFEVEGTRGDLPQWKSTIIQSYVYRMMELGNFRSLIQPSARDGEVCNVAAIKLQWETVTDYVVERSFDLRAAKDGRAYWHDERRLREAVVKQGVKYTLVDPFWLVFDIDASDVDDCLFIGDESNQMLHDLEQQAKNGFYSEKNIKLVRDRMAGGSEQPHDQTSRSDWPDQFRQARSIALGPVFTQDTRGEHSARRVRCIEMWAWFDFGDGFEGVVDPLGRKVTGTHRVVITLANGVAIQFRLNPFDRKFVPYAIGRANRNGHEMVAPSSFEQVIQSNASYDRYQNNVLRHSDLSVAPWLAVSGDWPVQSLLSLKPGEVIPNAGNVQEIKISDLPQSVTYMHQYFRREIEETSGSLRVFESPQGTATETERKVQEQQRMVRSSIFAMGELWRQVALKTYWMAAQFSTGPQRFAVVGKASSVLGKTFEVTPDILQADIDIRFLGLQNLHVYGNRLNGIAQWMNRWGPMLPTLPGVNMMGLARQDFELSVGRHGINEVFPNPEPAWQSWPQDQENEMLLAGMAVPISEADDHWEHIQDMDAIMDRLDDYPAYVQTNLREHYRMHLDAQAKRMEEEKAQMRQAQQQQMLLGATGGTPGVDKAPAAGGMEAPPPHRMEGVTPGPTQARTVAKTGREGQGISQQQVVSQKPT